MSYFPTSVNYIVTKKQSSFWLMTSNGHWISSHHSQDEAIAACRCWFKCSPSSGLALSNQLPKTTKFVQRSQILLSTLGKQIRLKLKRFYNKKPSFLTYIATEKT